MIELKQAFDSIKTGKSYFVSYNFIRPAGNAELFHYNNNNDNLY